MAVYKALAVAAGRTLVWTGRKMQRPIVLACLYNAVMSSKPPQPEEPSEDWQIQSTSTNPGQWEGDVKPVTQPAAFGGGRLKPITDALGSTLGPLWNDPRARPLILVSLLAVVGVCALACFILSLVLLTNQPAPVPPTPTLMVQATQPVTTVLIVSVNNTPIVPGLPNRLTIGNTPYTVTVTQLDAQGQWAFDRNAQRTAYWVPGTLVNYVLGLPANDENRFAYDQLRIGDLIVLDTAIGTLRYRVTLTQTVPPDDQTTFMAQSLPQLTLVLLGENGESRHLLIAHYTDEGTPNSLTTIGVPINLGDVRVTVKSTRLLPGASVGLTADKSYYQVNLQVTSLVTRFLDASQFATQLIDMNGGVYSLSSQGSFAAGADGWTQGLLEPGSTVNATAGFEVPDSMPGPRLEWTFSTEANNPYMARVSLLYEPLPTAPTAQPTAALIAEVTLLNVNISPEGNELRIVGTVRNLTDRFLPVSLRDAQLTSSGSPTALNASLPAFPWSITPGETLAFQLTFARPPGGVPAIFTLFGQSFEISGL